MRRDLPSFDLDPDATLPDLLDRAARCFPERGIAIFDGRGRRHERRTYVELRDAARLAAGRWSMLGLRAGDRVLVAQPTSWDWLDAWLGAVVLGLQVWVLLEGVAAMRRARREAARS